jgi:hypothetical protein
MHAQFSYGALQRIRRGCRKAAFKLNCLARPAPGPEHDVGPSHSAQRSTRRAQGALTSGVWP